MSRSGQHFRKLYRNCLEIKDLCCVVQVFILLIPVCTIPSCIFFWILARYRDGRFFFTFCMVDTIALEILYITYLIDYFLPGDLPVMITERIECMPVLLLMFVLMPYIYLNILKTLRNQQVMYEMKETENILNLQVANLKIRMEEFAAADEKFRMERHNFCHKIFFCDFSCIKRDKIIKCICNCKTF